MIHSNRVLALAWLLALSIAGPALADEEAAEGARKCVNAGHIRNTKIVDDSNIIFYMRGNSVYHNVLPRRCPGLAREGRFLYRSSTGNLCNVDGIRILHAFGAGLQEGVSCRLGYFQEIDEDDVDMIIDRLRRPPQSEPLSPAEPEDIFEETDES